MGIFIVAVTGYGLALMSLIGVVIGCFEVALGRSLTRGRPVTGIHIAGGALFTMGVAFLTAILIKAMGG